MRQGKDDHTNRVNQILKWVYGYPLHPVFERRSILKSYPGCLDKRRLIDQLQEGNQRLKDGLRYREKTEKEAFFGVSTHSYELPVKANSSEGKGNRRGGARGGHVGHGRKAQGEETAARAIVIEGGEICPDCGGGLKLYF